MPLLETIVPNAIWGLKTPLKDQLRIAPGSYLPCRMTIVRLPDGSLFLHSPIAMSDAAVQEIKALGEVSHIVAPNCMHHLFVPPAIKLFPNASVWCAPKLDRKRKDISFNDSLSNTAPDAWSDVFEQHVHQGIPALNEVVFFHKPTKTLIVTDLLFNVYETKGLGTPLMLAFAGGTKKLIQSRLVRVFTKDKPAAGESIRTILKWDFERVVMAHGRVVQDNAYTQAERAWTVMRSYT